MYILLLPQDADNPSYATDRQGYSTRIETPGEQDSGHWPYVGTHVLYKTFSSDPLVCVYMNVASVAKFFNAFR